MKAHFLAIGLVITLGLFILGGVYAPKIVTVMLLLFIIGVIYYMLLCVAKDLLTMFKRK